MSTVASKRRKYSEGVATIAALEERWPKTFFVPEHRREPLKVGIRQDIVAAGLGDLTLSQLSIALKGLLPQPSLSRAPAAKRDAHQFAR